MNTLLKKKLYIQLSTIESRYMSRSEARDVLIGVEDFFFVFVDYEHISIIGQAFADEIYRVFQLKYPHIKIKNEHMNREVKFMVERAKNEAKKQH